MAVSVSCMSCETKDWEQLGYHRNLPACAKQCSFSHQATWTKLKCFASNSSVDSVLTSWRLQSCLSLDAKEGFICIYVFQWLVLAGEGSLLLTYPCNGYGLRWKRMCEEAERLMNRKRELGTCGKKVHMQKKYRKVEDGNVAKSQKTMETLVGNSVWSFKLKGRSVNCKKVFFGVCRRKTEKRQCLRLRVGVFLFGYFYSPEIIKAEGTVLCGWNQNRCTELFIEECNHASKIEFEGLGWRT